MKTRVGTVCIMLLLLAAPVLASIKPAVYFDTYRFSKAKDSTMSVSFVSDAGQFAGQILIKPKEETGTKKPIYYVAEIRTVARSGDNKSYDVLRFDESGRVTELFSSEGVDLSISYEDGPTPIVSGDFHGVSVNAELDISNKIFRDIKLAAKMLNKVKWDRLPRSEMLRQVQKSFAKSAIKWIGKGISYAAKGAAVVAGVIAVDVAVTAGAPVIATFTAIGVFAGVIDITSNFASDVSGRPIGFAPMDNIIAKINQFGLAQELIQNFNKWKKTKDLATVRKLTNWAGLGFFVIDEAAIYIVNRWGLEPEEFRVIDNEPLTFSGGPAADERNWILPIGFINSRKVVSVSWDMYSIPDSIDVYLERTRLPQTPVGLISGTGVVKFRATGGNAIKVIINQGGNPDSSTAWTYTIYVDPNAD